MMTPEDNRNISSWAIVARDILNDRIFISTYQDMGYIRNNKLVILSPRARVEMYCFDYVSGVNTPIPLDKSLVNEAISWYQGASFLYKEKIEKSSNDEFKTLLTKEEVDLIFSNGLVIPAKALEKKLKLRIPPRFPKKVIDYAIYKFYYINSYSQRDKKDYVLFFANYIEDYESALNSKIALESLAKNITGDKSPRDKISWNDYIPKRFH